MREGGGDRRQVLVVDDDPAFLAFLRDGLGTEVATACVQTPLEALWFLERNAVDLVVCDWVLGHADGCHLLATVRERWPSTARVLVTGFGDHVGTAVMPPATVILKPCDVRALRRLLDALRRRPPGAPGHR